MLLPIWMLRGLQMKPKQKYGLAALFSMAVIVMIFELVRTVLTIDTQSGSNKNVYTALIFTVLEVDLAVIISALMVYRTLFRKRNTGYRSLPRPARMRSYPTTNGSAQIGDDRELYIPASSSELFGSSSFIARPNASFLAKPTV